jgi:surface protein
VPSKNIKTRTEVLQKFNLTQADIVRIFNDDECALEGLADNNETFRLFVIKKNGTEILLGDMPPDAVFSIRFRSIKFEPSGEDYSKVDITALSPIIKGKGGITVGGTTKNLMVQNNQFVGGVVLGGQGVVNFKQHQVYNQTFNGGVVIGGTIDVEYKESQKYFETASGGVSIGSNNTYYGLLFDRTPVEGTGVSCAGQASVFSDFMELVFNTSMTGQKTAAIAPKGTVDIIVHWGDGTSNSYNTEGIKSHTYASNGTYNVIIQGTMTGYGNSLYGNNNLVKILKFKKDTTDLSYAFNSCANLTEVPSAIPLNTTNTSGMFYGASSFNQDISTWDVSKVTDMSHMFERATNFNQDISGWDVSSVTNMNSTFSFAINFNQPLNDWDVSNVTNMSAIFFIASSFNQPLNSWDVSKVTLMSGMFANTPFNKDISSWNVSNVTDMSSMFGNTTSFNQLLNSWNVSKVTDMGGMFGNAISFNQPLNSWDVSKVTNMTDMFSGAINFNQSLNTWRVNKVTTMQGMFTNARYFNQDISSWDTISVQDMGGMFRNAISFNQPLSTWDVSNVTNMNSMFDTASSFNQPLNSWDVSNVLTFSFTFRNSNFNQTLNNWNTSNCESFNGMFAAGQFDQDISMWDFTKIFTPTFNFPSNLNPLYNFFSEAMSVSNMNNVLVNWDTNKSSLPDDLTMGGLPQTPTGAGTTAKTSLETNKGWNFI